MKEFLPKNRGDRKRGLSDIFTVLLGLLVGIGLFGATMMIYKQTQNTSILSTKIQQLMSISSEVEGIYATQPTYGAASADMTESIKSASSLPDSQFDNVTISVGDPNDNSFDIKLNGLNTKLCNRIAMSDLGSETTFDTSNCDSPAPRLVVNFSRLSGATGGVSGPIGGPTGPIGGPGGSDPVVNNVPSG